MKVIQHSAKTLQTALVCSRKDLAKLYGKYTKEERRLLEEGFHPGQPGSLFQYITVHSDSDWISAHPEKPQDFKKFYDDPSRETPNASRNTIYIQTIGDLLQFLLEKKPDDAFCIVGITMIDLYPEDTWNFVFGQASLGMGMGVFSFARYDDNFYSRTYAGKLKNMLQPKQGDYSVFDGYYTPPISSTLLLRSCKTMTHEIGHMFGIRHCQWLSCVMQGSNHLEESDRRPLDFCPICLRKLQVAIGFKIAKRYEALLHWMEEDQSESSRPEETSACQSALHFHKPTEAFQTSRLWLHSCLDILGEKR
ncbi:archaemetzincin-2 isoform X2 [Centropristis striata]|uniref:archaemetzincin-2 isoform X2 n=1 Tax=Centropristis striata TaxID=184440 RepID=UPI0027E0D28B|nr:archaemetzincin-2 isoform X2 [Centropristis striata]